ETARPTTAGLLAEALRPAPRGRPRQLIGKRPPDTRPRARVFVSALWALRQAKESPPRRERREARPKPRSLSLRRLPRRKPWPDYFPAAPIVNRSKPSVTCVSTERTCHSTV